MEKPAEEKKKEDVVDNWESLANDGNAVGQLQPATSNQVVDNWEELLNEDNVKSYNVFNKQLELDNTQTKLKQLHIGEQLQKQPSEPKPQTKRKEVQPKTKQPEPQKDDDFGYSEELKRKQEARAKLSQQQQVQDLVSVIDPKQESLISQLEIDSVMQIESLALLLAKRFHDKTKVELKQFMDLFIRNPIFDVDFLKELNREVSVVINKKQQDEVTGTKKKKAKPTVNFKDAKKQNYLANKNYSKMQAESSSEEEDQEELDEKILQQTVQKEPAQQPKLNDDDFM